MRLTETVLAFWDEVWNAHDPDAVDRFVVDDVVLVSGGQEISGKENFKDWISQRVPANRQRPAPRRHRDISERGRHPRHVPMGADRHE